MQSADGADACPRRGHSENLFTPGMQKPHVRFALTGLQREFFDTRIYTRWQHADIIFCRRTEGIAECAF
jgi:hypothetical protein